MTRLIVLLFFAFGLASCTPERRFPGVSYEAAFDPAMVEDVMVFMRTISEDWDLYLEERYREDLRYVARGMNAFVSTLYFDGDGILMVTNVGPGDVLQFSLSDNGKMPIEDLERLGAEVRQGLRDQLGIELEFKGPHT